MYLTVFVQPMNLVEQLWQFLYLIDNHKRHGAFTGQFLPEQFRIIQVAAKFFGF